MECYQTYQIDMMIIGYCLLSLVVGAMIGHVFTKQEKDKN
jgi:hypothetical protein